MIALLTGDVVNSRQAGSPEVWKPALEEALAQWGRSPSDWDLYRGDSFQVRILEPESALMAALRLKAVLRQIKPLDVRIAIGLGEELYRADRVSTSSGTAYERSGAAFDRLKKEKRRILFQSGQLGLNADADILLLLLSALTDEWSPASAQVMAQVLQEPELPQAALAERLAIAQSSVSERLKRAYAAETLAAEAHFRTLIHRFFPQP